MLLFGTGGTLVEVFKDRALGLPPLTTTLARRMMERTKIYKALQGVRGRDPVDLAGLEALLVRFGQLVADQRWIKEIDINPLFASADHLIALDARVVLYEPEVTEDELPELAIRPYPAQYIKEITTEDGVHITMRPIRPEDEPMMVKFHETLSERSVYLRYFRAFQLISAWSMSGSPASALWIMIGIWPLWSPPRTRKRTKTRSSLPGGLPKNVAATKRSLPFW